MEFQLTTFNEMTDAHQFYFFFFYKSPVGFFFLKHFVRYSNQCLDLSKPVKITYNKNDTFTIKNTIKKTSASRIRIKNLVHAGLNVIFVKTWQEVKLLPVSVEESKGDGGNWKFRRGNEWRWRIQKLGNGSLHALRQAVVNQRTTSRHLPSIIYTW